jgi:hypothetical protein
LGFLLSFSPVISHNFLVISPLCALLHANALTAHSLRVASLVGDQLARQVAASPAIVDERELL